MKKGGGGGAGGVNLGGEGIGHHQVCECVVMLYAIHASVDSVEER